MLGAAAEYRNIKLMTAHPTGRPHVYYEEKVAGEWKSFTRPLEDAPTEIKEAVKKAKFVPILKQDEMDWKTLAIIGAVGLGAWYLLKK